MANNKDIKRGISIYLDGKEVKNNATAIQAEMRKLKKEINGMTIGSEEYVAATKKYRELQGILREHNAQLGKTTAQVQDYGTAIKSALGLNTRFADSLLSLNSGGGLKGFFSGLTTSVKAFASTLTGLLANPAFLAVAGIASAGAAFKWWFDYNKGLEEATRLTREFLNIQGDELVAVRSEVQSIADTYGKDYKSVLTTVDNLMAHYGISAKEAMKVIENGFQAGADQSGKMLENIQQYSTTFHDAGVSASELTAILAQTRSGIFSEQGMQVIEQGSKRIREMEKGTADALNAIHLSSEQIQRDLASGSKSTFDVIQEISAKLRELPPDSQAVGAVLKDVFGRQGAAAGYQLITQLDTMTKDINEVKKVTGEYGEELERQRQASEELNTVMASLFDVTQHGFSEMLIGAKTFAIQGLTAILKGVINVINYFIEWYNESKLIRAAVQIITANFKTLWSTVKLVFNNIITAVKSVGRSLKGLGDILEGIVSFDSDKIRQGWDAITGNFTRTFKEVVSNAKDYGTEVANNFVDAYNNTVSKKKVKPITIVTSSADTATQTVIDDTTTTTVPSASGGSQKSKSKANAKATNSEAEERKRIQQQLAAIDLQYDQQVRAAREARMAGEIADAEALSKKLQEIELARLADKLRVQGMEESQVEALKTKVTDIHLQMYEELERQLNESAERQIETEELKRQAIEEQNTQLFNTMKELATSFGENLGIFLADTETSLGDFAKNTIKLILDTLEKILVASIAERTMKNVGALGFIGLAKNAGEIALLTAAFEAAKVGLSNWWTGGFTPSGKWNEPQGIVHSDEFVANRYAVANPAVRPVLDLIDRAQHSGNIANLTSSDIAAVASPPFPKGSPSGLSASDNAELRSLLLQCAKTMESATEAFQQPSLALCTLEGEGGVNTQQKLLDRIKSNAHRK